MKIKTKSGFKFELDERVLNDYRLVRAIARADDKNNPHNVLGGLVDLVSLIFRKDEQRLMEHIAEKNDGFVDQERIKEEIADVFSQVKALKNSGSSPG